MLHASSHYGSGAKVFEQTLLASQASIDTGATIPQGSTDLMILWSLRGTSAQTNESLIVRFNGSSSGYYSEYNTISGSGGVVGVQSDAATFGRMGLHTSASATSGEFGAGQAFIPCYSFTDRKKSWVSHGGVRYGTSNQTLTVLTNGSWDSTAAITQIALLPATGSFDVGSRVVIYAFE